MNQSRLFFSVILLLFILSSCSTKKSAEKLIQYSYELRLRYSLNPNPEILDEVKIIVQKLNKQNLRPELQYELKNIQMFLFLAQCDLKGLKYYILNLKAENFAYVGQQQCHVCLLEQVISKRNLNCIDALSDNLKNDPENISLATDVLVYYSMTKNKVELKEIVDSLTNLYSNPLFATFDTSDYKRYRVLDCH